MFSKTKYHIKVFILGFIEEWRKMLWDNSKKSAFLLKITDNYAFRFTRFGMVTKIMYSKQHLLSRKKSFEYDTLNRYSNLLKKGDIVLDIGANVGIFSLLGAQVVGNTGKIFAFEPSQITYNALLENLKLNQVSNIYPQKLALSNTEGTIHLNDTEDDSLNFIDTKNINTKGEIVEMKTLDNWLTINQLAKVDFIKIDIEGAEYLCFQGAEQMFRNTPPTIIMECNEKWCKRFDYTVFDLLKFLNGFGYTFEQYEEAQWICYPPKK